MKRFLLFGNYPFEAVGGWHDFVGDFDTLDQAITHGNALLNDLFIETGQWMHIIDYDTGDFVADNDRDPMRIVIKKHKVK